MAIIAGAYYFEDFEVGRVFPHHWGRTFQECDNRIFCSLTLQYNPMYFNVEYAKKLGYDDIPMHGWLVMNVVGGMSVADLSEGGGLFLGTSSVSLLRPVYAGDTVTSSSEIIERRPSSSRPGWGIVTWHTRGHNQRGELVIEFDKTNLVRFRSAAETEGEME